MATTFTRLDVEDVLSSIRKLVSDVAPDQGADDPANGASLFLLTPAHRIAEDTSRMTLSAPANETADEGQDVGRLHGETGDAEPLNLGTPVFVRSRPEPDATQDNEGPHATATQDTPDSADPREGPLIIGATPEEVQDLSARNGMAPPVAEEDANLANDDRAMDDPFAAAAHNSGSLEMRAAELEIAVSNENEQWEPDGSEAEPTGFPELAFLAKYREHARRDQDAAEPLAEGQVSNFVSEAFKSDDGTPANAQGADSAQEDAGQGADDAVQEQTLSRRDVSEVEHDEPAERSEIDADAIAIEALTKAILDDPAMPDIGHDVTPETNEPEPSNGVSDAQAIDQILKAEPEETQEPAQDETASDEDIDIFAAEPAPTAASPEVPVHERPMPVVIAFDDDDDDDPFDEPEIWSSDDDLLVDEDVLRRVVADIVRDELQGRLGERITRNVRRMVRREIEKALSTRHLE